MTFTAKFQIESRATAKPQRCWNFGNASQWQWQGKGCKPWGRILHMRAAPKSNEEVFEKLLTQ